MYCSTRGTLRNFDLIDTLKSGWVGHKELFIPENIPKLNNELIIKWSLLSYKQLSEELFCLFGGESLFSREKYKEIVNESFQNWPSDIIPIKSLKNSVNIAELYHGPSYAFKDVSLCVIGSLMNEVFKKRNIHCLNYTVTSGDTGSAVIECTKGKSNIDSFVFFSSGEKITQVQRLLMSTQNDKNIHNFDGNHPVDVFDFFMSENVEDIKSKYPQLVVSSLNSILWMRILLQMVHICYSYFQLATYPQKLNLVLPGGGLGHTTACLLVKKLGLPINITVAFNPKNRNTYDFFNGNTLVLNSSVTSTISPAIDIQYPTNIERIIYILSDGNIDMVKSHMETFYLNGSIKASTELQKLFDLNFNTILTSDEEILETMKKCYEEFDYVIDPHTAVGFHHYYLQKPSEPTCYMACASPIKFADVLDKVGIPMPESYRRTIETLKQKKEYVTHLPEDQTKWKAIIETYIDEHVINKL